MIYSSLLRDKLSQGVDKEIKKLETKKPIHELTPAERATATAEEITTAAPGDGVPLPLREVLLVLLGKVLLLINPEAGYLFGSSEDFCDVLLDTESNRGPGWDSGEAW